MCRGGQESPMRGMGVWAKAIVEIVSSSVHSSVKCVFGSSVLEQVWPNIK